MLVDGAHAVGARALDVPALGAHFYTSNLHKWLCTPKGSALLWVARAEQPRVLPPTTSHGYGLVRARCPLPCGGLRLPCSPVVLLSRDVAIHHRWS